MTPLRTESFVPLTPAAASGERVDFRVTVLRRAEQTQAFQPVGEGVSTDGSAAAPPENGTRCEPRVTVRREENQVSSIHVQCSCGQVIDLACVYQETIKPA